MTDPEERRLIRVLVADDSWHYGRALEATLSKNDDIDVVGIVYTAEELLEVAVASPPDVVLLDLDLPEAGGVAACAALQEQRPEIAVVVVTAMRDPEMARQCIALGAHGYVVKQDQSDPQRIASAIRSAARGDHHIDREAHQLLLDLAARVPDPAREAGLTPREVEVVPLIAEGLQNKEIAQRLGLSEQTVRNHLSSIYRKLDSRNRTQMTAEARRRRIIG